MTEPAKPGEFWGILAVVESVDATNRKATVSDEQSIIHPITWVAGYLDEKFAKLKPGYYRKFSGETGKPGVVTTIGYMGKDVPEPEWVKARYRALNHSSGGSGGSGWKGQPKNDRAIILQCCMKVAADVWISGSDKTLKYEEVMTKITSEAIRAAEALCTAGKVA